MSRMRRRRAAPLVALAAVVAGSFAGPAFASKAHATSGGTLNLAKLEAVPRFVAPGPRIDVKKLKGEKVFVIPLMSTNEYNIAIDNADKAIGKRTGVSVTVYNNQGQPNQWVSGMNEAIAQHAGAIILSGGADPRALVPQIAQARAAGIPVITNQFWDNSAQYYPKCKKLSASCVADVAGNVPAPYQEASRADVQWILHNSRNKANTLVLTSNDAGPSPGQEAAIKRAFSGCKDCTTQYVDIPVTQWTTETQSAVQSALVKDPGIHYILPLYDAIASYVVAGITAAGKTGSVKVVTFNGTPAVLKMIETGHVVAMDVGQDLSQIAYASMDQAFRVMLKKPASRNERDVIRIFEKPNVAQAGTPPKLNGGFGKGYAKDYLRLWGLG